MIKITGDTHGEVGRILDLDSVMEVGELLIVCGDWGYIFRDDFHEKKLLDEVETLPWTMAFVDGNHENFSVLNSYPVEEWNGGKIHRIRKNIIHLMRGQVYEIEGKKFFTFGGAYSVDKPMRRKGISWWKEELPDDSELVEANKNLQKAGMSVDYIITHTLPQVGYELLGIKPDIHEEILSNYLQYVAENVKYTRWYAGHFHTERDLDKNISILWFGIMDIK